MNEIERAAQAHRNWVKRFNRILACRLKPDPQDLRADCTEACSFGRWLRGDIPAVIRAHPRFFSLGTSHAVVHDALHTLALWIQDGHAIDPVDYDRYIDAFDQWKTHLRALTHDLREQLRAMDPLTGIGNRLGMMVRLEHERARIRRGLRPCAVAMIDIDHFKSVNDEYGHAAGDLVLRTVADLLVANLRPYDDVFRYGGEEFLLCLPETESVSAAHLAERLRHRIAKENIILDTSLPLRVTASFGISQIDNETPLTEAVRRADVALYVAKNGGRNRIETWRPEGAFLNPSATSQTHMHTHENA